jgi:hypothetical protein
MILLEFTKKAGAYEVSEIDDSAIKMMPKAFIRTVKNSKNVPALKYAAAFDKDHQDLLTGLEYRRM